MRSMFHTADAQILGAAMQDLVATSSWRQGAVHAWCGRYRNWDRRYLAGYVITKIRLSTILCNIFGVPVNNELYYGLPVRDVHN